MPLKIALLPGDGIGPEVTEEAVRVLKDVAEHAGTAFQFSTHSIGGVAIDAEGVGLPEATLEAYCWARSVIPNSRAGCRQSGRKRRSSRCGRRSAATPTCGRRSATRRSRSARPSSLNV